MIPPPARKPRPKPRGEPNFLLRFLDNPKRTGAVAPSGPFLARAMARAVDPAAPGLVVELGPGTGPVTRALLTRGVPRERLVLVEFDPQFCQLLARRFQRVRVVRGDAFALGRTLGAEAPVAAVVSSLPLLNVPPSRRLALLDEAFALMGPDGVFVQFTYGLVAPISREVCAGRYVGHTGGPIWRNFPPASVWVYRRARAGEVARKPPGFDARALIENSGERVLEALKREVAVALGGKRRPRNR